MDSSVDALQPTRYQFLQVGILTKGKPTLGMALVSLLVQETCPLEVFIVDTAHSPVVKRDDVVFALRLGHDRGVYCGYEYSREKRRAFSVGRLKLLEAMTGPFIAFMDDDIILPPSAVAKMMTWAKEQPIFGYVSPRIKNYGEAAYPLPGRPHYSPGGIIYQDSLVRSLLLDYYSAAVDVLDAKDGPRLWENAFLSELFPALGRPCLVKEDCVGHHLDYRDRLARYSVDERIIAASVLKARQMAQKALAADR